MSPTITCGSNSQYEGNATLYTYTNATAVKPTNVTNVFTTGA